MPTFVDQTTISSTPPSTSMSVLSAAQTPSTSVSSSNDENDSAKVHQTTTWIGPKVLDATPDEDGEDETGAIMMTLFESLTRKISMLEKTVRLRKRLRKTAKNDDDHDDDDDDDDTGAVTSDGKDIQSLLERLNVAFASAISTKAQAAINC